MTTAEISKAVKALEVKTLQDSLKALGDKTAAKEKGKEELVAKYQSAVLETGAKNFVGKLKTSDVKAACKASGLSTTDEKDDKQALEEFLLGSGINSLLSKVDDKLLLNFCKTLSMEGDEREGMIKQITDEIILTGMEKFLTKLTSAALKAHCSELKQSTNGTKTQLVDRLMVHIFELEPLEENGNEKEEKSPSKAKKNKKEEKSSKQEKTSSKKEKENPPKKETRSSKAKETEEETEKETEKETKKESKKKESKKPKESKTVQESTTKEKWVSPPLTTIGKKYSSYTDLYDNFNLPDLVTYCKENDLKVSGKKKEVIQRILNKVNGVEEKPKAPKKRKASAETKKRSKKQKTEEKE